MTADAGNGVSISPVPTDEEAVAIAAAVGAAWPISARAERAGDIERWRWSGRWWTKPMALRRDRPW